MNILKRFWQFQEERFPLKILVFTTAATVMTSAAILGYSACWCKVVMAFFTIMFFLYHIRVIDESRDFGQDSQLYPGRPVQRGLITIRELFLIDLIGIALIILFSVYSGWNTVVMTIAVFLFTTLAWKDFFLQKFFADKPLLYHIVNSPQMALILILVYTMYTGTMHISPVMWMHLGFVYVNIFILEMIRKIKVGTDESAGTDTYSVTMGYKRSLLFTLGLILLSGMSYAGILMLLGKPFLGYILYSLPVILFAGASVLLHRKKAEKRTEKLVLLSVLLVYVTLNALICIFNLN